MQIQFISDDDIYDDLKGRIVKNQVLDLPDHKARFYIGEKLAVCYQTKVMQDRPCQAVGAMEQLSASPAAQVLPQTIVNESANGVQPKKRGRKKKEA